MERDKVDKAAVGFDYKSQAEKHDSQKGESQQPGELGKLGEVGETEGAGGNQLRGKTGSVRAGAGDCAHWGTGQRVCNLLQEWWKSYRKLLGMGQ